MERRGRSHETRAVTRIFIFNGDADGLCALQQLALAEARAVASD